MQKDDPLAAEDARRRTQHEAIKGEVGQRVRDEVVRESRTETATDHQHHEAMAESLKQKAIREFQADEAHLERGAAAARISQVVDYVFYVVYGFIALAIVLEALGARQGAGFKQFVDTMTAPLLGPFRGLVHDPSVGAFQFMVSYAIALVVYILLHAAINGILRLFVHRKVAV